MKNYKEEILFYADRLDKAIDIEFKKKYISKNIENKNRYSDDYDIGVMHRKDYRDLKAVVSYMRRFEMSKARKIVHNIDTAVRDIIPVSVYNFIFAKAQYYN